MSALHAHFHLRNQHAFQRALEGSRAAAPPAGAGGAAPPGSSGGKSWTRAGHLKDAMAPVGPPADVNTRDWLGRTVLHLASAATDNAAVEYVRMLLAHPAVNVNLHDRESNWTALHRALYHGNLASAILLLQRADTDPNLKDLEGYTAYDLYNSTIEGTKPPTSYEDGADLFTWGTNRNAHLGHGDSDDRAFPEHVVLRPAPSAGTSDSTPLAARLVPLRVRAVALSKLHTVVLTAERRANVRACGFGSGGRLGGPAHTQYALAPLASLAAEPLLAAALGQDHTLVLSRAGEVFSWGLNRFAQLGYALDPPAGAGAGGAGVGKQEEPIQAAPKRVQGPLRSAVVRGVAACKTASACWTAEQVFTWGTNSGQLGYDKAAQPVQVLPRVVTKIPKPVITVALTETAMACLLESYDVLCFAHDRQFRINFPTEAFPSEIVPYRPPQSVSITKLTACEGIFAALSAKGEVFTFSIPAAPAGGGSSDTAKAGAVKPARVWSLRKKFSAARDVALGTDGGLLVCTESGHVYVRARAAKGAGAPKFARVPFLQRAVAVAANATGAHAALRVEYAPRPVELVGNGVREDIARVRPWLVLPGADRFAPAPASPGTEEPTAPWPGVVVDVEDKDDEGEDEPVLADIHAARRLLDILRRDKDARTGGGAHGVYAGAPLAHGADMLVCVGSAFEFPAHRLVAGTRSAVLRDVLATGRAARDAESKLTASFKPAGRDRRARLVLDGVRPLAALLLFTYLYTDDVPAVWDRRVAGILEPELISAGARPAEAKRELRLLARLLDLPRLDAALEPLVKRVPAPALLRDVRALWADTRDGHASGPIAPDVVLRLADIDVRVHSLVLRARSPLFAAFFDDPDWTARRWTPEGTIEINMRHLTWRQTEHVLRWICAGEEEEMFERLDDLQSIEDVLDFMFDVKAAANELHLHRLMLVCARVVLQFLNVHNAGFLLAEGAFLHSAALVDRVQAYMTVNMETLLESRLLDELAPDLVRQLAASVRTRQRDKAPVSRSTRLVDEAMKWYGDWLALQDIPTPVVPSGSARALRESRPSPPTPTGRQRPEPPVPRPQLAPLPVAPFPPGDDVFIMDDTDLTPTADPTASPSAKRTASTWKMVSSTQRTDLRSIMAETRTTSAPPPPSPRAISRQPSQGEWRKVPGAAPSAGDSPSRAGGSVPRVSSGVPLAPDSPLRAPAGIARAPSGGAPSPSPSAGRAMSDAFPSLTAAARPGSTATPRTIPPTPGLGPVISPARQGSSARVDTRRTASTGGKAWTLPPVQSAPEPSPPATGFSFADIQALQVAQARAPEKDKRSLREIQAEEAERRAEDDFLKWWAEEEERTRVELGGPGPAAPSTGDGKKKKRPPRKPKADGPPHNSDAPGPSTAPARPHHPAVGEPGQAAYSQPSSDSQRGGRRSRGGGGFRGRGAPHVSASAQAT